MTPSGALLSRSPFHTLPCLGGSHQNWTCSLLRFLELIRSTPTLSMATRHSRRLAPAVDMVVETQGMIGRPVFAYELALKATLSIGVRRRSGAWDGISGLSFLVFFGFFWVVFFLNQPGSSLSSFNEDLFPSVLPPNLQLVDFFIALLLLNSVDRFSAFPRVLGGLHWLVFVSTLYLGVYEFALF